MLNQITTPTTMIQALNPSVEHARAGMLEIIKDPYQFGILVEGLREEAEEAADGDIEEMAERYSELSGAYGLHFEEFSELSSLEEAILSARLAVDLTSDDHPEKSMRLSDLARYLFFHFDHFGDVSSLEDAISAGRQAVELTPESHPIKSGCLNNLASFLSSHFDRFQDAHSLEAAMSAARHAIELTPDEDPSRPTRLTNLAMLLNSSFNRFGDLYLLEDAITSNRQALELTPDDHPKKAIYLDNLVTQLATHFDCFEDVSSLEEAISIGRQAVKLLPDGHVDKPGCLNNLASNLSSHFEHFGDVASLEDAISVSRKVVQLTPDSHPKKQVALSNLAAYLWSHYCHSQDVASLEDAFWTYKQAGKARSGPPSERLHGARRAAELAHLLPPGKLAVQDILGAHQRAIELVPEVAWLGEGIAQRYEELISIGGAVNEAARAAISLGRLDIALEWLDQGRGIVWGQLLQLRMPKDDLREQYPNKYDELQAISYELQSSRTDPSSQASKTGSIGSFSLGPSPEDTAAKYRILADRYDKLVEKIRKLKGFERFLLPKTLESLIPAAGGGPIVIVNVHEAQCDAIILCPSGSLKHVPLAALTQDDLRKLNMNMKSSLSKHNIRGRVVGDFEEFWQCLGGNGLNLVLRDLWSKLVQPVLEELGEDLYSQQDDRLPHITWCTTGPLSFLPIHAAGIYDVEDGEAGLKLHDFVVSSYTTTLSALIQPTQPLNSPLSFGVKDSSSERNILIVSQPATPGLNPIPLTAKEAEKVKTHFPGHALWLNNKEATKNIILSTMSEYQWIHLACHGTQDRKDPLKSAFHLYDSPLDLQELMSKSSNDLELAFLSACETAMGDPDLPEEMVHLTAGMLSAGFRSVVGTMWAIQDHDGPKVADKFYEKLMGGKDSRSGYLSRFEAAYALHDAVTHLREEIGEDQFHRWIPFVHFGM